MEALKNYLTEIQSANVSQSVCASPSFYFNNVKDYYAYQGLLRSLEFNCIDEYLVKITSNEKKFWQRIYAQYLQQTRNCFMICEKGDIYHQNFHMTSVPLCGKTEAMLDKARIHTQNFIHLQFESISRIHTLITDPQDGETSSYHWTGKQIQLLEIGHAFLVCGYILPLDKNISKQHWFNAWFRFFHQSPPVHMEQSIYKMTNREQPARFLAEFNEQYHKYMDIYP